ncbi:MAG: hypothetical protein AAF726_09930 [Planctomycetota bacterium]
MKLIGSLLLTAGFLAGAYASVAQVDSVNWLHYGLCAALMVAGMLALRAARAADLEQAGEKHDADIAVLQSSLDSLISKVRTFESAQTDEDQLAVHLRIDDELMEDIETFVDARESMIPKLGMQRYADIMSPFANGERLLNRAWSASADGYVDEVRSCIASARAQLEMAAEELASA